MLPRNFTKILNYTGVLAVLVSCVVPPTLALLSKHAARTEFGDARHDLTVFTLDRGRAWPKVAVIAFGALLITIILVSDVEAARSP